MVLNCVLWALLQVIALCCCVASLVMRSLQVLIYSSCLFVPAVDWLQAMFIRAIAITDLVNTILGSKGMWRFSYTATVCVQSIQIWCFLQAFIWVLDLIEKKRGVFSSSFHSQRVLLTSIAWLGNCILSFASNLCPFSSGQGSDNWWGQQGHGVMVAKDGATILKSLHVDRQSSCSSSCW
jgi:hypothetical protein